MKKILSCGVSMGSAMLLRDALENFTGVHVLVSSMADSIGEEGCLIRYGNGFEIGMGYPDTIYNSPLFIEMCKDKRNTSNVLSGLGILVPRFRREGPPAVFPAILRTTLTGSRGEGIIPVRNSEEFQANFHPNMNMWWTDYFPTKYEVRAYVVNGCITHTYYKVPFEDQEGEDIQIRSDYHYSYTSPAGRFSRLKDLAKRISESTGAQFFSIDAGYSTNYKDYVVFELNSGSWMNRSIVEPLARYLASKLEQEFEPD